MDRYAVYFFSATGNSYTVAASLTQRLGAGDPISIPGSMILDDPYEAARTATKIGFVFPVHRATLPEMVRGFIARMPVRPECYYFALSTYTLFGCNEFWDIDDLLREKGAVLNLAASVRMMGSVGLLPPSEAMVMRRTAQMQTQLDDIAEEVANGQETFFRPSVKLLKELVRRYTAARRRHISFSFNEHCTSCGICAQVCPARNITLDECASIDGTGLALPPGAAGAAGVAGAAADAAGADAAGVADGAEAAGAMRGAPVRSDKCLACYACIHWCPANAVSTSPKLHNRYHYPKVSPGMLNQVPEPEAPPEDASDSGDPGNSGTSRIA
ncbi:MAG: EFR1 family ferrodoxin [Coriobacteriales bacterium]|jgi:ferredoxin|nr:EFR1 family ferrodoxin [Coriobacteriales bacterium]